jgi:exosortase H (IPTLxxWG-CTERM-specific)
VKRLALFAFILIFLCAIELLEPVHNAVIMPFTAMLAYFSASIVQLFDPTVQASGIILRSLPNGAAVEILPGCNGVEAMICLAAAIVSYPAQWHHKVLGLIGGFIAVQALNTLRIISLFYLLQWNRVWFDWAHLYLWQPVIILDALLVFIIWLRMLPHQELTDETNSV